MVLRTPTTSFCNASATSLSKNKHSDAIKMQFDNYVCYFLCFQKFGKLSTISDSYLTSSNDMLQPKDYNASSTSSKADFSSESTDLTASDVTEPTLVRRSEKTDSDTDNASDVDDIKPYVHFSINLASYFLAYLLVDLT